MSKSFEPLSEDHGWEKRGIGFQCVEGDACRKYVHPGDPGFLEIAEWHDEARLKQRNDTTDRDAKLLRAIIETHVFPVGPEDVAKQKAREALERLVSAAREHANAQRKS